MIQESDPKRLAQIALVVLLIIGCIALLLPFIGAILFAFVVWICTWPLYAEKLLPRLGGRNIVGASLMTLALILVLLLPTLVMAGTCAIHMVFNEITCDHSAATDKEFVAVEGATHNFTPCRPEFGDTRKAWFDYVDAWLSKPGRF